MNTDKIAAPGHLPFAVAGRRDAGPDVAPDEEPDEAYDIRIARDGTWFYHGSPIGRIPLVRLFASVLKRDESGDFWLITPAERGRITVEDAPFVAVELKADGVGDGQSLAFRTNLDDWVTAGPDHPIRIAPGASGNPSGDSGTPYILVRDRLEARIGRAVFYELVELAVERSSPAGSEIGVWSERIFFPLGTLPEESPAPPA
jgi:hypothetical protein